MNNKTISIEDPIKAAQFIAQLTREGITFDVCYENGYITVTLTGGF
jgi:predicted chitinase